MKIKVCQLKLRSKHMLYAERIKSMIPKWEIKERRHTSTLKSVRNWFLRVNTAIELYQRVSSPCSEIYYAKAFDL